MKDYLWETERDFQLWACARMDEQGWHTQILNDQFKTGLPDVTAAHPEVGECWMEFKHTNRQLSVHQLMRLEHPLTAQQKLWLTDRKKKAPANTKCGVMLAFWTQGPIPYVRWVPIDDWRRLMDNIVMQWALSPYSSHPDHLHDVDSFADLVEGRANYLSDVGPRHARTARGAASTR